MGLSYERGTPVGHSGLRDKEFLIKNLLENIYIISEMIWRAGLVPWEFQISFPSSLVYLPFQNSGFRPFSPLGDDELFAVVLMRCSV